MFERQPSQGCRRLGVTATLVREDGREGETSLVEGYDLPWQFLKKGFVAEARCFEVPDEDRERYENMSESDKFRSASENPKRSRSPYRSWSHKDDPGLSSGPTGPTQDPLQTLRAPLITGKTPHKERDRLFAAFRTGEIKHLVVSKVANFAIDLPDANVAIQISACLGRA